MLAKAKYRAIDELIWNALLLRTTYVPTYVPGTALVPTMYVVLAFP